MTDRFEQWQTSRDAQDRMIHAWAKAKAAQQQITNQPNSRKDPR